MLVDNCLTALSCTHLQAHSSVGVSGYLPPFPLSSVSYEAHHRFLWVESRNGRG